MKNERLRQAAFSNINFSILFYQASILVAKRKTIDYASGREDHGRARRESFRATLICLRFLILFPVTSINEESSAESVIFR